MLTLPDGSDLIRHEAWIKAETLATRIEPGEALAIAGVADSMLAGARARDGRCI